MCSKVYNFVFLVFMHPLVMIAQNRFDQIISHIFYRSKMIIFYLATISQLTMISKLEERLFNGTWGMVSDIVISYPPIVTSPMVGQTCLIIQNKFQIALYFITNRLILVIISFFHRKHTKLCLLSVLGDWLHKQLFVLTSVLHLVTLPRSLRSRQWFPLHSWHLRPEDNDILVKSIKMMLRCISWH